MTQQHDYDVHVRRSITIDKAPEDLYRAWRQPENLVRFVAGVQAVDMVDDKRSKWTVEIPGVGLESWTSQITEDRENQLISWRTIDNPRIEHEGTVHFTPAPNELGTEVKLEIRTHVPGGAAASAAARLLGRSPKDYVARTLHNSNSSWRPGKSPRAQARWAIGGS